MHKSLDGHCDGSGNALNLRQRQFARHHYLFETGFFEPLCLFGCAVIHLCRCVERNGRQREAQQCQILHDEGINSSPIELPNHSLGLGKFVVVENSVEGHVNTCAIEMGKPTQSGNIVHTVACRCPGTKSRSANIDRVGTMEDSLSATFCIACGREQFDGACVAIRLHVFSRYHPSLAKE